MPEVARTQPLRVLVVDDTAVYRKIVSDVLAEIPNVLVIGAVASGRMALARLKSENIDLMILDLEMPELDGLATLEEARADYPDLGVVMLSDSSRLAADKTVRALELGALDFLAKGARDNPEENRQDLLRELASVIRNFHTQRSMRQIRTRLSAVSHAVRSVASSIPPALAATGSDTMSEVAERPSLTMAVADTRTPTEKRLPLSSRTERVDIVVIGSSTGGPQALAEVIPELPGDLGVPVLVVQHMPPVFTASLAQSLNQKSRLEVLEAQDGQPITAGQVLIAPGGRHMVVQRAKGANGYYSNVVSLNDLAPENSCRPSVDVLFRSVGAAYGGNVLAVIMTGMGEDGMRGVRALKQRGCYCITQDAQSCVIYGMPRAVDQAGLSDESASLKHIAARISMISRSSI